MEPNIASQVPPELSEWLLLVATHKDKAAFTQLFHFFAPKIKRFGLGKLNTESMANELLQETMTNVWKKAYLYDFKKGAATTWVYTVMRNVCFDMLRKVKSKNEQNLSNDIWPLDLYSENNEQQNIVIENIAFKDHLMDKKLLKHIDDLPFDQKTVVNGIYYQELSQERLAQLLDVPLGTVKSRLRLALDKLKQKLENPYHD